MQLADAIRRLSATADAIAGLTRDVPDAQAHWKPAPDAWAIVEVVNHLVDEERDDFRARLRLTLEDPAQPWPRIDPAGWVVERRYNDRPLAPSLEAFLEARQASLAWLRTLVGADWTRTKQHPNGFTSAAGDLLAAWVGHDLLHVRQLTELQWADLQKSALPYKPDYAGDW